MKVLENIQALRGIAVFLVLLVHVGLVEKKYSLMPVLPDLVQFGMSGVDIFFVISGFIMMTITMSKQKDVKYAFSFLYSRIIRIYPLYWFYSLLVLIAFVVNPNWVNSSNGSEVHLVESFLLIPQDGLPLLAVGWTLIHEMYFYIGFFILLLFLRSNNLIFTAIALWGAGVIGSNLLIEFTSPFLKIITHPLTLEFVGGAFIAYVMTKMEVTFNVLTLKALFVLALLLPLVNYVLYDYYYNVDPSGWLRVLLFGLPAMLLLYVSLLLEKSGLVMSKWLVSMGDRSYTIYLAHVLVINAVGRIWQMFLFENIVMSIAFILILITSTLLFAKYAYMWIEVPMLKYLKRYKGKI